MNTELMQAAADNAKNILASLGSATTVDRVEAIRNEAVGVLANAYNKTSETVGVTLEDMQDVSRIYTDAIDSVRTASDSAIDATGANAEAQATQFAKLTTISLALNMGIAAKNVMAVNKAHNQMADVLAEIAQMTSYKLPDTRIGAAVTAANAEANAKPWA